MPTPLSLSQLTDLALGTPEVGAVNFNVLHTLLHAIIAKLQIQDAKAEIDESDRDFLSRRQALLSSGLMSDKDSGKGEDSEDAMSEKAGAVHPVKKKTSPYHQLEVRVEKLAERIDQLNALPSSEVLYGKTTGKEVSGTPVADMWQGMQLKKRVDAHEEGINKLCSVIEDMMKEIRGLKDASEELMNKYNSIDLDAMKKRLDELAQKNDELNAKFATLPLPEEFATYVTWPGLEDALRGVRDTLDALSRPQERVVIDMSSQTEVPSRPSSSRPSTRQSSLGGPTAELLDMLEKIGKLSEDHEILEGRVSYLEEEIQKKANKDDLKELGVPSELWDELQKLKDEMEQLRDLTGRIQSRVDELEEMIKQLGSKMILMKTMESRVISTTSFPPRDDLYYYDTITMDSTGQVMPADTFGSFYDAGEDVLSKRSISELQVDGPQRRQSITSRRLERPVRPSLHQRTQEEMSYPDQFKTAPDPGMTLTRRSFDARAPSQTVEDTATMVERFDAYVRQEEDQRTLGPEGQEKLWHRKSSIVGPYESKMSMQSGAYRQVMPLRQESTTSKQVNSRKVSQAESSPRKNEDSKPADVSQVRQMPGKGDEARSAGEPPSPNVEDYVSTDGYNVDTDLVDDPSTQKVEESKPAGRKGVGTAKAGELPTQKVEQSKSAGGRARAGYPDQPQVDQKREDQTELGTAYPVYRRQGTERAQYQDYDPGRSQNQDKTAAGRLAAQSQAAKAHQELVKKINVTFDIKRRLMNAKPCECPSQTSDWALKPEEVLKLNEADTQSLARAQQAILQLQAELDRLNNAMQSVIQENRERAGEVENLLAYCNRLNQLKADKEYVAREVDVKADKRQLENKVNTSLFDTTTNEINNTIKDILSQLAGHEEDWKRAYNQLTTDLDAKLDRLELDPLKEWLEARLKALSKKIQQAAANQEWGDDEAAGLRKQLLQRFHCLSCDRPVEMMPQGKGVCQFCPVPSIPQASGMPATRSPRPYTTYELDQIRQHAKKRSDSVKLPHIETSAETISQGSKNPFLNSVNMTFEERVLSLKGHDMKAFFVHFGPKKNAGQMEVTDYYATTRQCGGSHTMTLPHKRTTRLSHLSNLFKDEEVPPEQPFPVYKEEVDVQGVDGHIYKGRVERVQLEAKLPTTMTGTQPPQPNMGRGARPAAGDPGASPYPPQAPPAQRVSSPRTSSRSNTRLSGRPTSKTGMRPMSARQSVEVVAVPKGEDGGPAQEAPVFIPQDESVAAPPPTESAEDGTMVEPQGDGEEEDPNYDLE